VLKLFTSFAVKWFQLQKNIIWSALLRLYVKINVLEMKLHLLMN